MIIQSYTYSYLLIILILGILFSALMIFSDICIRAKHRNTGNSNQFISNFIINNDNEICKNDYEITNNETNLTPMYHSFIKNDLFNKIKEG